MKRMRTERTDDERRGKMDGTRFLIVAVVAVMVLSACGGGSESVAAPEADTGSDSGSSTNDAVLPSSGGSDYCRTVLEVLEEAAVRVDEDETQVGDLYTFMLDIFRSVAKDAPSELESDFALVVSDLERYAEWIEDPLQPDPLSTAEQAAFEAANERINAYMEDECGIDMGAGDEELVGVDPGESGAGNGEASTATQTVSVGGNTYEETLSGVYEISCDLYGDLETGSIGIYLDGADFQSSISSYDTGVQPGTYLGSIWVFASDPALDELTWDLQEIDGEFILIKAEEVSDSEWLYAGTFSATVEDPPASIEATFSCVGTAGY